jgi:hypothetical protein
MRDLLWFLVLVTVYPAPLGAATASPEAAAGTAASELSADGGLGLQIGAPGSLRDLAGSGRVPLPETPIIQARPKQFIRVLNEPALPDGDRTDHNRHTAPNNEMARCTWYTLGLSAIGRCVLFCRFLR